jgi:heme exporter protein A
MNLAINSLSCQRQQENIFENVSFQLRAGEALILEGPNGAGKSSLLRLIAGLATPTAGSVHWQNKDIHESNSAFTENLHYIGHQNGIKLGLTVIENIELTAHLNGVMLDRSLTNTVVTQLSLDDKRDALARQLSAGQKRRLALTKLFLFPKILWLLDEPFTALDANSRTLFTKRLEEHLQNNGMCIMSTHHRIDLPQTKLQILRLDASGFGA